MEEIISVNKDSNITLDTLDKEPSSPSSSAISKEVSNEVEEASDEASTPCSDDDEDKTAHNVNKKKTDTAVEEDLESDGSVDTFIAKDLSSCKEAFELFDLGQTGFIPREKLRPCLNLVFIHLSEEETMGIIDDLLDDEQETVDFNTFTQIVNYMENLIDQEKEITEAFRCFDPHRKGYITAEDLNLVLISLGATISVEEAQQLISILVSKDGRFYYEPFVKKLKEMGLLDELRSASN